MTAVTRALVALSGGLTKRRDRHAIPPALLDNLGSLHASDLDNVVKMHSGYVGWGGYGLSPDVLPFSLLPGAFRKSSTKAVVSVRP
jgi:hypothetical protein